MRVLFMHDLAERVEPHAIGKIGFNNKPKFFFQNFNGSIYTGILYVTVINNMCRDFFKQLICPHFEAIWIFHIILSIQATLLLQTQLIFSLYVQVYI